MRAKHLVIGLAVVVFALSAGASVVLATDQPDDVLVYVSSSSSGTVDGMDYKDEDILVYDSSTDSWAMHFDGSDLGLIGDDINAFHILNDNNDATLDPILFSLKNGDTVAGLSIDDSDVVRFTPTSLGTSTAGTFSMEMDGSDFGLTTNSEEIDAIAMDQAGRLLISTDGSFRVPTTTSGTLRGADEDLIAFDSGSGTWSLYFDGSDVGLTKSTEDVWGAWVNGRTGELVLTTKDEFSVAGLSGDQENIFTFTPSQLGENTSGSFAPFWNGDTHRFADQRLDGLSIDFLNAPPVAEDDTFELFEDAALSNNVLADNGSGVDSDPDGDPLTVDTTPVSGPSNGSLTLLATGDFTYRPDADFFGTDTFEYEIDDGNGETDIGLVTITVLPVNDEPSFIAGADETVLEDAGAQSVAAWATAISAGPANEASQLLTFTATNDNNGLFSTQPAVDSSGQLTYEPAADANGTATVMLTLTDNGGTANGGDDTSTTASFSINITAVNDEPSFTKGTDESVLDNAGLQTVSGWATALSTGPADEAGQTLSFTVTNDNNTLFSTQPAIDSSGQLTYTPALGANGTTLVSVTVKDNGGTANGGDDTSPTQTFNIAVTATGTIVVEKQTLPDGAAQSFAFTGNAAGTLNDNGQIVVSGLAPGTYTSTETALAGWDLTNIACDDGGSTTPSTSAGATATFKLDPGEIVKCTFTNTQQGSISILKATNPAGGTGFGFTDDIEAPNNFSLDDGQTQAFTNVVPGTYTVTEDDPTPGWDLTGLTCDDGGSSTPSTGSVPTRSAIINVDPGEAVTCTFTNTERGTITIIKEIDPDDPQDFSFTDDIAAPNVFSLDDDSDPTLPKSTTFTNVLPGTYTVTEDDPTPASLIDLDCVDTDAGGTASSGVVATRIATIELDPGETVTCTFTNSFNTPPTITSPAAQSAPENQSAVATLTATDPDLPPQTLTWSETGGADASKLSITSGGVLSFDSAPDFENPTDANTDNVYVIDVQVSDGAGGVDTQTVSVTVTDVNDAPAITSDAGGPTASVNAAENQTTVTTVTATDEDLPAQTLTFSITGGADQAVFSIGSGSGELTFNSAPDFETPGDADTNNDYEVQVTVTDNGAPNLSDVQDITVTVTDVLEVVAPDAVDDSYDVIGNVGVDVQGAGSILNNDLGGAATGLTFGPTAGTATTTANGVNTITTTNNGVVELAADGTFTYDPAPGFEGTDSFFYEASNAGGADIAEVSLTVDGMIWFINPNVAGSAGTLDSPFSSVPALGVLDDVGDCIFVVAGPGNFGQITLLNQQVLVGDGSSSTLDVVCGTGLPTFSRNLPAFGGTDPTFSHITLANDNTVRGLDLLTTSGTSLVGSDVDALVVSEVDSISNSGGPAIDINGGVGASVDIGSATSNGGTFGIDLTNSAGSTFTFGTVSIVNSGGTGFNANTSGTINIGGASSISTSAGTSVSVVDTTIGAGGVTFASISNDQGASAGDVPAIILTNTGAGAFTSNGGTIENITDVDAIRLSNTDGLVTLANMVIEDIAASGDSGAALNTRSGVDGIHGQDVDGGLTLTGTTMRRFSDNAVNGALFIDGLSATTWTGLSILNSTIEDSNRFAVATKGDASDEGLVRIVGITGTVVIDGSTLRRGGELIDFFTSTGVGTLQMTVTSSVFDDAYKEFTSGATASVGKVGIDVTVQGSHNANVTIGDGAETNPSLGNEFIDNGVASMRIIGDTGSTGTINATVSQNTFRCTDHSSTLGTAANFPQGGVLFRSEAATFNGVFSNNTFGTLVGAGNTSDECMNADGAVGNFSLVADDSATQVRVSNNTFNGSINAPWNIRVEGTTVAKVLLSANTYNGDDSFFSPDPFFGTFRVPGLTSRSTVRDGGTLDITVQDEDYAYHETRAGLCLDCATGTVEFITNSTGGTHNVHLNNVDAPNGFDFSHFGGTLALHQGASASVDPTTILSNNSNTGGDPAPGTNVFGGTPGRVPPEVDVTGTLTIKASVALLPSV